jgi:hypothetical protein
MIPPPLPAPPAAGDPFADVPHGAAEHVRLALFGVVARIVEECDEGGVDAALEAHPFLADYHDEVAARVGPGAGAAARWRAALARWEARAPGPLPLGALLRAGMSRLGAEMLLAAGVVEEDPRFGDVFARAQGHERRPTFGLLLAWWRTDDDGGDRVGAVRRALLELVHAGLLAVLNPEAPRPEWALAVPHPLWDALRGDPPALRWLTHVPHEALPSLDGYVAPGGTAAACAALPALLRATPGHVVVVRGPARNGRGTLLGCVARALGRPLLVADEGVFDEEPRWRLFGALAALLGALPVVRAALSPGETRILPPLPFVDAPLGVVAARHGAWCSAEGRPVLTLDLPLPGPEERARHWAAVLPGQSPATREALAAAARLTSGNVRRAAGAAAGFAALEGRAAVGVPDLRRACRGLQSARLETLATRLPAAGTLDDLAVDACTREELDVLAARCRHRERLAAGAADVAVTGTGVRALLAGPSGTGKTLAARLLAASLGRDVYRVDLSATVNKYLGETEKNLDQAFAAAEELDVVLLLDEGDALMANRTDVSSSNDRYANLETNFLLQRIESFDGILLVTSNAADRIDRAFARRMDVVIDFHAPDEWRRYDILRLHLPACEVDDDWLQQAACRCALTGGQLRNVASHARLLALQDDAPVRRGHLYAAFAREYRKTGGASPLRPAEAAAPGSFARA